MTQRINWGALGGKGIVAVLIIAGIVLWVIGLKGIGYFAIGAGIVIGIIYGLLGAAGIARRIGFR